MKGMEEEKDRDTERGERGESERNIGREAREQHRKRIKCSKKING